MCYAVFCMLLNTKEMVGVAVLTRSGQSVGKVISFDLDAVTGQMMRLRIQTGGLVAGLLHTELYVVATAVISMSLESVVIADAAVTVGESASASSVASPPVPGLLGRE